MSVREIKPEIYWVGVVDWDRRMFDELIPLPDGTSYNSYVIKGSEKTALIDTVDPTKERELIENLNILKSRGIGEIDYVVANHAEQDHSGAIPKILEIYPGAKVVTNSKCKTMLMDLLLISDDRFLTISDKDTLSLGNHILKFITAPWVHWPETMFTYCEEDKILFTCDFLGSHLATSELFSDGEKRTYNAAKRYYAEIMMPFKGNITKYLETIKGLDVKIIAPSHGPIHKNIEFIINAYSDWISDKVKNEVVVCYVSMHGSTKKMVDHLTDALIERGIAVKPFNLTKTDIGELASAIVDSSTIVIVSPTVLLGPHPAVVYGTYLVNALRPKLKFAAIICSYGWGGKMIEQTTSMLNNLKVDVVDTISIKGHPKKEDFESLDLLADKILKKHKEILK